MTAHLDLGEISIDVLFKDIKNVHLSVLPPAGRVRIAAPVRMSLEAIRIFAISKLDWIKRKQQKFREQARETPREYLNRESHYLWGKSYLLTVIEGKQTPSVEILHDRLLLRVGAGASIDICRTGARAGISSMICPCVTRNGGAELARSGFCNR